MYYNLCAKVYFIIIHINIEMSQNLNPQPKQNPFTLQKQSSMFTGVLQSQKRRRTDVLCTCIGAFFFIICISLSIGFKNNESLTKFNTPSDSTGKICGKDYPEHPFLYFTNLPGINQRVCVSACPKEQDPALKCMPLATVSCLFSQTVRFAETQPVSDHNGHICMPVDPKTKKIFIQASKLASRVSFSNPIILLTYEITIILSILLTVLLNFLPRGTMEAVQYLSLIGELILAISVYIQHTQYKFVKFLIFCLLGASFLITISQILIYRQELKLNRVFMAASSNFFIENKGLACYILFFQIMLCGFFKLLLYMYSGLISNGTPTFNPQTSLFYVIDSNSYLFAILVLIVCGLWGLSIIQQLFNFCISAHTINWYLKLPNNCQSVATTLKLLFTKHLGSVVGGAFVNGFFFIPQVITDLARSCQNSKQKTNNCLINAIDLARADALSFIILSGLPYCNASKYCEYLWNESMISDQTQSSIHIYKLAAHMLIATIGSIIGLFLRSQLDPYLLAFTLMIGLFITTFFIEFNAVCSETLQLLYIMEEEFYKRKAGRKSKTNVLNRSDQLRFVQQATSVFSNQEVALELIHIRKDFWKLRSPQKVTEARESIAAARSSQYQHPT